MRVYFVARLPVEFADIHKELLEGRIRFGWGAEGLDLRNGEENFVAAYTEHFKGQTKDDAVRRYNILSVLMRIHVGDIILLPKVSINRPEVGNYFTIAECTEEYSFAPLPNNDFGHVIGVKLLKTFNYRDVNSKINLAFRFRAINKISHPETIQYIEELLGSLPTPEDNLNSMMDKVLATQESYLEEFLRGLKNLPPDAPLREEYLRKVLMLLRTFLPDTLKKIVKELFEKKGYRLLGEDDSGFTFEIFSERELMHDFYAPDEIPKIFVVIKNLGDSYENTLAQFDKVDTAQTRLLIDLAEQFDEKIVATAKEKGVVLIDGMTFATTLIYHKV